MDVAMLWYNNDPKMSLYAKVVAAIAYYKEKYGKDPHYVAMNPKTKDGITLAINGVTIEERRYILPNYFLIGVNTIGVSNVS